MVETGEYPKDEIKREKDGKNRSKSDQEKRNTNTKTAYQHPMFILKFIGKIGHKNLKEKSRHQTEIGQDSDMRIILDDKLLAVEQGENHGNRDSGGVIEKMEEGS